MRFLCLALLALSALRPAAAQTSPATRTAEAVAEARCASAAPGLSVVRLVAGGETRTATVVVR